MCCFFTLLNRVGIRAVQLTKHARQFLFLLYMYAQYWHRLALSFLFLPDTKRGPLKGV